jgi:hypothetical protein
LFVEKVVDSAVSVPFDVKRFAQVVSRLVLVDVVCVASVALLRLLLLVVVRITVESNVVVVAVLVCVTFEFVLLLVLLWELSKVVVEEVITVVEALKCQELVDVLVGD